MKLAMAQMRMGISTEENLSKTIRFVEQAGEAGADLIFFPEVQLSPFFPQYEKRDAEQWAMSLDGPEITAIRNACRKSHIYASPNVYLKQGERRYDASLMINADGRILGVSKMVHIAQAKYFYEQDYYTPSDDGFKVFNTPFGRVGIVICYDRHLPESIRTCTLMGAQLVIIPTANTKAEPMEMFEWEIRVQAMQNQVFIAMCNRVGTEGDMDFAGESIVVHPSGDVICKADDKERLVCCEIDLAESDAWRAKKPYIPTRRPECYL